MELLKKLIKEKDKGKLLAVAGLAGILLLAFPYSLEGKSKKADNADYSKEYIQETEKRLTDILQKIEGVGDVSVMLTLESSEEVVYARNEKESCDLTDAPSLNNSEAKKESTRKESTYVFSDYGSDRSALRIMSTEPRIKGVIVVCEGGGSSLVRSKIVEAASTVLGIKYADVFVAKSK